MPFFNLPNKKISYTCPHYDLERSCCDACMNLIEECIRYGFSLAIDNVEISTHDGWNDHEPLIDSVHARKLLEEALDDFKSRKGE